MSDRLRGLLAKADVADPLVRDWFRALARGDEAASSPAAAGRRPWTVDFTSWSPADLDAIDRPLSPRQRRALDRWWLAEGRRWSHPAEVEQDAFEAWYYSRQN